jgi:hypothetical protein
VRSSADVQTHISLGSTALRNSKELLQVLDAHAPVYASAARGKEGNTSAPPGCRRGDTTHHSVLQGILRTAVCKLSCITRSGPVHVHEQML